ncbi:hypothetical protein [Maribacter sp. 2307UL18-2]|uniref:hypothetical protein n=1 Tax=Maribacter sp. 2307UL18-2 TaxID=3386274 RepID=UPI0039BC65AB
MKLISKVVFPLISTFAMGYATNTSAVIWEQYTSGYRATFSSASNVQIGNDKHKPLSSSIDEGCASCNNSIESRAVLALHFSDSSIIRRGVGIGKLGNSTTSAFTCELVQKDHKTTGKNRLVSHYGSASSKGTSLQEYIHPNNTLLLKPHNIFHTMKDSQSTDIQRLIDQWNI